jgi:hypothetical protein
MPRLNLSVNNAVYEDLQREADDKGISINNLVYSILRDRYGYNGFDILTEFENLKREARAQDGFFNLNNLPTFQNLETKLKNTGYPESVSQVKARLGRMFMEAVEKDQVWNVDRAVSVDQEGNERGKTSSRAAVYSNSVEEK